MSLLDIGTQCAICPLVDFLPTSCPHCGWTFCRDHISAHHCPSASKTATSSVSEPSTFDRKAVCELQGCKRPSIEAIGGCDEVGSGERIAKQVRCQGCSGSFCTVHRRQDDHLCPAPRDHTVRADAADLRKLKAAETLAKHFPSHPAKEIAKPTAHTRDLKRQRPASPPRLPPSLQPSSGPTASASAATHTETAEPSAKAPTAKSKEAKMFELHIRKLRIGAKALDPKQKPDKDRRFFEIRQGVTSVEDITAWKDGGKALAGVDKVWIHQVTPIGKVLDMVLERNKIPRPGSGDVNEVLKLVNLSALPGAPRQAFVLELSQPCSSIPEGSTVGLVKGWRAV